MSLDVTLYDGNTVREQAICHCCDGTGRITLPPPVLYDVNLTHNLNSMAAEAGIYLHIWCPEELGITKAGELIEPLRAGLALMKSDPARFEAFNSSSRWGTYEQFVPWVERYLAACEEHPTATIQVSS